MFGQGGDGLGNNDTAVDYVIDHRFHMPALIDDIKGHSWLYWCPALFHRMFVLQLSQKSLSQALCKRAMKKLKRACP